MNVSLERDVAFDSKGIRLPIRVSSPKGNGKLEIRARGLDGAAYMTREWDNLSILEVTGNPNTRTFVRAEGWYGKYAGYSQVE